MLGNYEKRHFKNGESVWVGRYRNLTNVLHWHFECELIHIVRGRATVKIDEQFFSASTGDSFFCAGGELHYIISDPDAQVEIVILDESLTKGIADKCTLTSSKLSPTIPVQKTIKQIEAELIKKEPFYREALEACVKGLLVDIFRSAPREARQEKSNFHKNLIDKINDDFSLISFEEAAQFSGYSPSHFSKIFKKLSGRTFSQYLNIIKVEHAILLLRDSRPITITEIASKCGFSTVRNFNRVFKDVTGFSPRTLPADFDINIGLGISQTELFDPTDKNAVLL